MDRVRKLATAQTVDWHALSRRVIDTCTKQAPCDTRVPQLLEELAASLPKAITLARQLIATCVDARVRLQPIMRDARREHFLFTEDRVTGLIDYGAMTIDTPAVDFARLLGEWSGEYPPAWEIGLPTCQLPAAEAQLLTPLDRSGLVLSCANWLRWIAEGHTPNVSRLLMLRNRMVSSVERDRSGQT